MPPPRPGPVPRPRPRPPFPPLPPAAELGALPDTVLWRVMADRLFGDDAAWLGPFSSPEIVRRVAELLAHHDREITEQLAEYNARQEAGLSTGGRDDAWRARVLAFQRRVRRRRRQLQDAVQAARRMAHEDAAYESEGAVRKVLAQLSEAVAEHQNWTRVGSQTPADVALWRRLDELTVPIGGRTETLRTLLRDGTWGSRRRA